MTDAAGFTCPRCGAVSHNPNDARERYCGRCHVFVDDVPRSPEFPDCVYPDDCECAARGFTAASAARTRACLVPGVKRLAEEMGIEFHRLKDTRRVEASLKAIARKLGTTSE
jgi:hypothetical protein